MKIRTKFIIVFVSLTSATLIFISRSLYINAKSMVIEDIRHELDAVATIQKSRIQEFIERDLERVLLVSSRTQMRISLRNYLVSNDPASARMTKEILIDALRSNHDFERIEIVGLDKKIIISTENTVDDNLFRYSKLLEEGKKGAFLSLDTDKNGQRKIYLAAPLVFENNLLGVVIIQENLNSLLKVLEGYAGLQNKTGECVLAVRNSDGNAEYITPRKFSNGKDLPSVIPMERSDISLIQALLKKEQSFYNFLDYRQQPVFSVTRYIDQTGWGLVLKIDQAEVFEKIETLKWPIITTGGFCLFLTVCIAILFGHFFSRPLFELKEQAQKIAEGQLDVKISVKSKDEIGQLAQMFSQMMEYLQQQKSQLEKSKHAALSVMEDSVLTKEAALKAEKRFEQVIESAPSSMVMVNEEGNIVLANKMTDFVFGYRNEEIINQPIEMLIPSRFRHQHPAYRKKFFQDPTTRAMGAGRDLFGVRKDGREVPVEIGLNPVEIDKDRFVLASIVDITERKHAEKEIMVKNKELETLLYIISHDLKEPLRSMEYFSLSVKDKYSEVLDDKGRDYLTRVVKAGQRMKQLLDDILMLSRARRIIKPIEFISGKQIVDDALARLASRIQETNATVNVADSFPDFQVEPIWAVQAIFNLVSNALKYVSDGKSPEIEIKGYKNKNTNEVGIMVSDSGPGVKMEYAEKIFELFQRAVDRDIEGTGAGLAIVKEIAVRHGGRAWYSPRKEGGSEFTITFNSDAI